MTETVFRPGFRPTGRSLWKGKDLSRSKEWIVPLPEAVLAEIDDSVKRLRARGAGLESISRQDFPLKSFAAGIESLREEILDGRGFFVLRGLDVSKYSVDELSMIFWGIGTHFGVGIPQSFLGDRLGHVMDLTDEEPDARRRRAYHSRGELRVHTDSCDILGMLSVRAAISGGESRLSSAHTAHNLMLDNCPGLLEELYKGIRIRIPDSDAESLGKPALTDFPVPAFKENQGRLDCFFVRGYVLRAVNNGDVKLSPKQQAAIDALDAFSNHPDVYLDMNLLPGDMQIFNNRTVFHGRRDFENPVEKDKRRLLLRLWLKVPEWPKMADIQGPYTLDDTLRWEKRQAAE